jgi:hypothetical protein
MPEHADPQHREAPEGLEHKDTRGALIGYSPSQVPNRDRTGSALDDDERRKADQHGDLAHGFSGVPEADADNGGIHTASGGTQSKSATSSSRKAAAAPKAQTSGGENK